MARIRVRFRINPGRTGTPLDKLGGIASQSEKFLRFLAADLGLQTRKGQWLAVNFDNGSVSYDAEFVDDSAEIVAENYMRALSIVTEYDPARVDSDLGVVSQNTLLEYAGLGKFLDPDEAIIIGLYNGSLEKPERWCKLSYRRASEIIREIEAPIVSYGAVQGMIHAWYKGVEPPYFQLRELATESLVKCIYSSDDYEKVHAATKRPNMVLLVTGHMRFDRVSKTATEVRVEGIEVVRAVSDDEFEHFFGSAPDLTGSLSTDEYIETIREDGD